MNMHRHRHRDRPSQSLSSHPAFAHIRRWQSTIAHRGHGPCCSTVCEWNQSTALRLTVRTARSSAACTSVPADGTIAITGNPKFPVNEGGLCAKGWSAADTLRHPERLLTPLARDGNDRAGARWNGMRRSIGSLRRSDRIRAYIRTRCDWRLWRRIADQRKGVPARQICAGGGRHSQYRLQRPILHVVCGRGGVARARHRSRPAVSARRHSASRG